MTAQSLPFEQNIADSIALESSRYDRHPGFAPSSWVALVSPLCCITSRRAGAWFISLCLELQSYAQEVFFGMGT